MEDRFQYIRDKLEFELEKVGSSNVPIKLLDNIQNTDEIKLSSSIKEKVWLTYDINFGKQSFIYVYSNIFIITSSIFW